MTTTPGNAAAAWRDLADQLTLKQVACVEDIECTEQPTGRLLLNVASSVVRKNAAESRYARALSDGQDASRTTASTPARNGGGNRRDPMVRRQLVNALTLSEALIAAWHQRQPDPVVTPSAGFRQGEEVFLLDGAWLPSAGGHVESSLKRSAERACVPCVYGSDWRRAVILVTRKCCRPG